MAPTVVGRSLGARPSRPLLASRAGTFAPDPCRSCGRDGRAPRGQSKATTSPSAGRIILRNVFHGVEYAIIRTLPSPKTNCGPAGLGDPQLPPPQDSFGKASSGASPDRGQ